MRVTDPALLAGLRSTLEASAARYMKLTLRAEPADPDAIWFFRIE